MPRFNNENCASELMIRERIETYCSLTNEDLDIIFEHLSLERVSAVLNALSAKSSPVNSIEFQLGHEMAESDPSLASIASALKAIVDENNASNDVEVVIKVCFTEPSAKAINIIKQLFTDHSIKYTIQTKPTAAKKTKKKKSTQDSDDDLDIQNIENLPGLDINKKFDPFSSQKKPANTPAAAKSSSGPKSSSSVKSSSGSKSSVEKKAFSSPMHRAETSPLSDCTSMVVNANQGTLLVSPVKEATPSYKRPHDSIPQSLRTAVLRRKLDDAFAENAECSVSSASSNVSNNVQILAGLVVRETNDNRDMPIPTTSHEKMQKKNTILAELHIIDAEQCVDNYSKKYGKTSDAKEKIAKKEGGAGNPKRIEKQYCKLVGSIKAHKYPLKFTPVDAEFAEAHKEYVYPGSEYYYLQDQVYIKGLGLMLDPFRVNNPDNVTIQIANDLFRHIRNSIEPLKKDGQFNQLLSSNISIKRLICAKENRRDQIVIVAPSGHTDGSDGGSCSVIKEKFWHILAELVARMDENIDRYRNITFLFETHYNRHEVISAETMATFRAGDYYSPHQNKSLQTMLIREIDHSLGKKHPSYAAGFTKPEDEIGDKGCSEMKTLSLELKLRSLYDRVEIAGVENTSLKNILTVIDRDSHGREYASRLPCKNCMRTIPAYNVLLSMHELLSSLQNAKLSQHASQAAGISSAHTTLFVQRDKPKSYFASQLLKEEIKDTSADRVLREITNDSQAVLSPPRCSPCPQP